MEDNDITYRVHCAYKGWLPSVTDNRPSGGIAEKFEVQAFECKPKSANIDISYQAWDKEKGWGQVVKNGELCGTTGKGLPLLGFRIFMKQGDQSVFYRIFKDSGWSDWYKDGEEITSDKGFYAIQIALAPRDGLPVAYRSNLDEIGLLYGTDKSSLGHDYLDFYEKFFAHYRNDRFTLAEVGIFEGASIRMWEDFFPNAKIIAFDIKQKENYYKNTEIIIGNATDPFLLAEALMNERPFIFIEDGSHLYSHQIATFETAFNLLMPGGFYVCEDIQTSFGAYRKMAYNDQEKDAMTYFGQLAYLVANMSKPDHSYLESVTSMQKYASQYIDFIVFRKHCVLIKKKAVM